MSARRVAGVPRIVGRREGGPKTDPLKDFQTKLAGRVPSDKPLGPSLRGADKQKSYERLMAAFRELDLMEVSHGDRDGGF